MLLRSAIANLYWYQGAAPDEQAEVAAWMAEHDCSDIEIIGIDRTVVAAFGAKSKLHGWGTTEMRSDHDDLTGALAEAIARLRNMRIHA